MRPGFLVVDLWNKFYCLFQNEMLKVNFANKTLFYQTWVRGHCIVMSSERSVRQGLLEYWCISEVSVFSVFVVLVYVKALVT